MTTPHILVVGSANTDLVVSVPAVAAPGETVLGGDLRTMPGGKGANQAVAAARLGAQVTFIARVGDDLYGQAAIAGYQSNGIDTRFVLSTPGVPSGVALITVDAAGENAITVAPGANSRLSAADVLAAAAAFDTADAVIVSLEIATETVAAAVHAGYSRGVRVIVNPAPARVLPSALFGEITLLTPNEIESSFYGGANALRRMGVPVVVTTRGSRGAVIDTARGTTMVPAVPVNAVDTVAAGDCFTAALTVCMAQGVALPEATHYACAAAALKVTRRGGQPSLPYRNEVESFLAEHRSLA